MYWKYFNCTKMMRAIIIYDWVYKLAYLRLLDTHSDLWLIYWLLGILLLLLLLLLILGWRLGLGLWLNCYSLWFLVLWKTLWRKKIKLTLVMLNKLRCHAHFKFSANQITWSRCWFVCVEVLWPSQPNGVMSSMAYLPDHTFTGQT